MGDEAVHRPSIESRCREEIRHSIEEWRDDPRAREIHFSLLVIDDHKKDSSLCSKRNDQSQISLVDGRCEWKMFLFHCRKHSLSLMMTFRLDHHWRSLISVRIWLQYLSLSDLFVVLKNEVINFLTSRVESFDQFFFVLIDEDDLNWSPSIRSLLVQSSWTKTRNSRGIYRFNSLVNQKEISFEKRFRCCNCHLSSDQELKISNEQHNSTQETWTSSMTRDGLFTHLHLASRQIRSPALKNNDSQLSDPSTQRFSEPSSFHEFSLRLRMTDKRHSKIIPTTDDLF